MWQVARGFQAGADSMKVRQEDEGVSSRLGGGVSSIHILVLGQGWDMQFGLIPPAGPGGTQVSEEAT